MSSDLSDCQRGCTGGQGGLEDDSWDSGLVALLVSYCCHNTLSHLLSYSSGGQMSDMGLTGLKSRCQLGYIPFPLPAFRGYTPSLAHAPSSSFKTGNAGQVLVSHHFDLLFCVSLPLLKTRMVTLSSPRYHLASQDP